MAEVTNQNATPAPQTDPAPAPAAAPQQTEPQAQAPQLSPEQQQLLDGLLTGSKNQPQQQPQTPQATQPPQDPNATTPTPGQQTEPGKPPNEVFGNAPFAQMRIQNKALQDALEKVAPTLGIDLTKLDSKDPEALQKAVVEAAVKKQAETQQQDPVMAAKLYNAEQKLADQRRETNAILARHGFAQVQQEFKLDQKGLEDFANDLVSKGMNPYDRPMDLVAVYKVLNIDKIIASQVDTKVAAQLQSQQHSTAPNPLNGAPGNQNTTPITTVSGLDALLKARSGS